MKISLIVLLFAIIVTIIFIFASHRTPQYVLHTRLGLVLGNSVILDYESSLSKTGTFSGIIEVPEEELFRMMEELDIHFGNSFDVKDIVETDPRFETRMKDLCIEWGVNAETIFRVYRSVKTMRGWIFAFGREQQVYVGQTEEGTYYFVVSI